MSEELGRIIACHRDFQERLSNRFLPSHIGSGLFNSTVPRIWDRNYVRLEDPTTGPGEVIAFAERTHALAGIAHRRIWVDDPEAGERLAPSFAAGTWEVQRLLVMVHRGAPEVDADLLAVAELKEPELRPLRDELSRGYGYDEETRTQLLDAQRQIAETLDVRFFGVRSEGRVISCCELYSRGAVAQIEDVVTAPAHRNKGHARAVVLRALEEARRGGHDLVFLLAEEGDWPKELYGKLGFEPLARLHGFLKRPA